MDSGSIIFTVGRVVAAGLAGCEVCGEDVRPGGVAGCGPNRV